MISKDTLFPLQGENNLLAFSAGVDSSALFFLLLEANIPFDLAIVNYQMRKQSQDEVAYAQELANKYGKKCHLLKVSLDKQNFEASARAVRYEFFERLIKEYTYHNLITAHQLDDRLEWFLMQLSKGSGLAELMGMRAIEKRESYTLVRPLLEQTKSTLLSYLETHNLTYFYDESNSEMHYKRNFFRAKLATPLLKDFQSGILKSFTYLDEDRHTLTDQEENLLSVNEMFYFEMPSTRRKAILKVDAILKDAGFLMRQGDKELLKSCDEHVVGRKYVVSFVQSYCFVAPFRTSVMDKAFKEQCRALRITPKLRGYLFQDQHAFKEVSTLLS